jgi:hypothetical protein
MLAHDWERNARAFGFREKWRFGDNRRQGRAIASALSSAPTNARNPG